ncbi:MAG: hypothetical protein AAGA29_00965 [Planctomycetota bacterium]
MSPALSLGLSGLALAEEARMLDVHVREARLETLGTAHCGGRTIAQIAAPGQQWWRQ